MLILHHRRDNLYRLLPLGSASVLNDVVNSAGVALRYSEVEGFVAKGDTRAITFQDRGNGAYEMRFSNVRRSGEIIVTTVEMRRLQK